MMKRQMRVLALSLGLLLASSGAAEARRVWARFFLDGAFGASVPIADSTYSNTFYPQPKLGLRLGAELWLSRHFGIAPELAIDGGPLIWRYDGNVHGGKGRFQVGLRLLAGFGHGHAFFARFLVGVEVANPFFYNEAAFATEPGIGMQFRISRHGVAGFTFGFPIAVYRETRPFGTFVDVDFDAMGFIGLRI